MAAMGLLEPNSFEGKQGPTSRRLEWHEVDRIRGRK